MKDEGEEPEQAEEEEETAILSMIHTYQVAEASPLTPDTPCLTCATQGQASGEQSMDTEMTMAAVSLLLSYPTPAEMVLSSEMTQAASRYPAQPGMKCSGECFPIEAVRPRPTER